MTKLTIASEGLRILAHSIRKKAKGYKKYKGDAKEICSKVVKDCWNGRYFQASAGHFCQFYSRDFGFCIDALIKLGYKNECEKTIEHAMKKFQRNGRITVAITPFGKPFDFPSEGIDSLAFMAHSLAAIGKNVSKDYSGFISSEAERIFEAHIDLQTGLVKKKSRLSSMKDYSLRKSSCYDNVMAAIISSSLKELGIKSRLSEYNYAKIIKKNFWNGSYFEDELEGKGVIAGDANVFPYWSKLFTSKAMMKKSIESIKSDGLDEPLPLKYTSGRKPEAMIPCEFFVQGWQRSTSWTNIGILYLGMLKQADKAEFEKQYGRYKKKIERQRTYAEVYSNEKLYRSFFYHSDTGMLWASNFLVMK